MLTCEKGLETKKESSLAANYISQKSLISTGILSVDNRIQKQADATLKTTGNKLEDKKLTDIFNSFLIKRMRKTVIKKQTRQEK